MYPVERNPKPTHDINPHIEHTTTEIPEVKERLDLLNRIRGPTWHQDLQQFLDSTNGVANIHLQKPSHFEINVQEKAQILALTGEAMTKLHLKIPAEPGLVAANDLISKLLSTKGKFCTVALVSAVGLATMSNITPTNAEMLLKAKQLSGVMIQMATVTSNQGSFDTIRSTYDNLAKMDMLSVRKTVADIAEPIMENLGDQFSQQQKDMFVDWMSFPDAKLWRAVGEIIKGFDPAQVMAQSCVLLNSIAMFSPLDTYLYHPKDLKKSSDVVYGAAEDYVNAAMDALKSASSTKIPIKSGDIFRDSIAIACNAATYGVELSQGGVQLLPRRAVATVLATATARLAQQYFQANVSPETKFGDFI